MKAWQAVIGLEVHVELKTESKLFSVAPNRFGDAPNTNITEVCSGQPGALPVLNEEAIFKAILFGAAINAEIATKSSFDRKSYFYPDSPRNFQITQFYEPIIKGGHVQCDVEGETKEFAIDHAHLEDDAGMLKHYPGYALVDYNRAGVPLLEIVSKPCMHSPKQAAAYASSIRAIMLYLGASDCNMEEGSMRMDANVSVRLEGEENLRTKTEIKNLNSFSNMEKALEAEIKRQVRCYSQDPAKDPAKVIQQATYRWDAEKKENQLMRRKESSDDYRYFPEPDLPDLLVESALIKKAQASIPELPFAKEKRYIKDFGLKAESAKQISLDKLLADFFEEGLEHCKDPIALSNWILVEFAGRLEGKTVYESGLRASNIADLVNLIDQKTITGKIAKKVADEMLLSPQKSCKEIIASKPEYQPLNDRAAIEKIVDEVLAENPKLLQDYKDGKEKVWGFFVGQAMKKSRGKAAPDLLQNILEEKIHAKKP